MQLWDIDLIQFARLISELQSAGAFTPEVEARLLEDMDLYNDELYELVERADRVWECVKKLT